MTIRQEIPRIAGALVGLLGIGFVLRLAWTQRRDLATTLAASQPGWLVVALVVGIAGMAVIGLSWRALITRLGGSMRLSSAMRAYFVGQLGKYVPGGVWAVVGRGEWARRDGVGGAVAYASTFLSMVTAYVAGALVAGVALVASGTVGETRTQWLVAAVVALGPIGLVALHPRVLSWLIDLLRRSTSRQLAMARMSWGQATGVVLRQLPAWLGIGTATWLVSISLGADLAYGRVMLATCVAWVTGFLFLPVPGGIGVREAAFVGVLGQEPIVATTALAARLLFVAVDVAGAGLATAVARARTAP